MDDPGHPTDIAGAGKDTQSAAVRPEAKPYMNIKVRGCAVVVKGVLHMG
jgi:hypothetical protein